jgi:uncharacterized membrane protein
VFKERKFKEFKNLIKTLIMFGNKYQTFLGNSRKNGGTEYLNVHYIPVNVVALMCSWKIT